MRLTEKQKNFISSISDVLGLDLKNSEINAMTKQEATKFIGNNIDEFYQEVEMDSLLISIQNEDAGFR